MTPKIDPDISAPGSDALTSDAELADKLMASDGRTCWGKTYAAAVADAMKYDAKPYGEHQNDKLRDGAPETPPLK